MSLTLTFAFRLQASKNTPPSLRCKNTELAGGTCQNASLSLRDNPLSCRRLPKSVVAKSNSPSVRSGSQASKHIDTIMNTTMMTASLLNFVLILSLIFLFINIGFTLSGSFGGGLSPKLRFLSNHDESSAAEVFQTLAQKCILKIMQLKMKYLYGYAKQLALG